MGDQDEPEYAKLSAVNLLGGGTSARAKKHDLESVLTRAKDSFVKYRYLFDSLNKPGTKSLMFEYGALWCIAHAIRKQLAGSIIMEGQEMVFAFPFSKMPKEVKSRHVVSDGVFNMEPLR